MLTINFNQERDVISNLKNVSGSDLLPNRFVKIQTEGGVAYANEADFAVIGILKPSDETIDGEIPNGRNCDIVVNNEYEVEIVDDVSVGDLLVIGDSYGRVRALSQDELESGGETVKKLVVGIALGSATYSAQKTILVPCRIQKMIVEVSVTS